MGIKRSGLIGPKNSEVSTAYKKVGTQSHVGYDFIVNLLLNYILIKPLYKPLYYEALQQVSLGLPRFLRMAIKRTIC